MSLKWITLNDRLQNGAKLINSLPTNKFKIILTQIQSSKGDPFTEEELTKLQESLKLNSANLQLLIQCIAHIFKQSSKVILKPTVLQKQLVEDLKLDEEKSEEFVKIWLQETKNDFGNFEDRLKLEDMSWEINLQTASKLCSKETKPNARIHFKLSDNHNKKDNVTLELDEEELLNLYNNLEMIQAKLDNL
ncbi:unnamed protein product [Brassicogethes aeneus]|uniref:COMM domain-containing protein n=1 Tax=Brassicogethes aeneus TaxID=1431903 RepID=A0A9P0B3Z3_BRAAE|nr:unnamed protein product [Brassicogethes aeneus]